jgi:hypothetical protein
MIITQMEMHNRSVMVKVLGTPYVIPPHNSKSSVDVNVLSCSSAPHTLSGRGV